MSISSWRCNWPETIDTDQDDMFDLLLSSCPPKASGNADIEFDMNRFLWQNAEMTVAVFVHYLGIIGLLKLCGDVNSTRRCCQRARLRPRRSTKGQRSPRSYETRTAHNCIAIWRETSA